MLDVRRPFALALVAAFALVACARTSQPATETVSAGAAVAPAPRALPSTSGALVSSKSGAGAGVAVVELFTSEGCSSCPAADRVLSRLAVRAATDSLAVYPLSFHVDYWNYLGWTDRFSSASYSERQRAYAAVDPSVGIYTPQAVINGEDECVGSDSAQLDSFVTAALKRTPRTQVELTGQRTASGIDIAYRVSGDTARRVLNLAVVEPHAESAVKSGENSGARLAHVNVVRAFTSRALSSGDTGTWAVPLGAEFAARRVGVVAYAEAATQRDVSGATALEL